MTDKQWRLLCVGEIVPKNAEFYDPDEDTWESVATNEYKLYEKHRPVRVPIEPQPAQAQHIMVTLDDETKKILSGLRRDLTGLRQDLIISLRRL
jgi:hypothetical protein